jgi:hypothetical protein
MSQKTRTPATGDPAFAQYVRAYVESALDAREEQGLPRSVHDSMALARIRDLIEGKTLLTTLRHEPAHGMNQSDRQQICLRTSR